MYPVKSSIQVLKNPASTVGNAAASKASDLRLSHMCRLSLITDQTECACPPGSSA